MKWFRFYSEFRADTKIKRMPIAHRYAFVILLCLANECDKRGEITHLDDEDIAFELEIEVADWHTLKDKFRTKGFIEPVEGGIKITNWDKRQFASDSSAERVRKHRIKKKERPSNVTVTEQKRECNVTETILKHDVTPSDTDTDPETYSYSPLDPDLEGKKGSKESLTTSPPGGQMSSGGSSYSPPGAFIRYVGSQQFLEERPWIELWRNINTKYNNDFVASCVPKLEKFEAYKNGATIADVKRYLGKGNYDTPESNQRANAISAWWEEFQYEEANRPKKIIWEVVESECDRLLRGGIAS